MKWVLLALSLYALLVAYNVLFLVPGNYDEFNFVAAGAAISVAAVLAWFSGRKFAKKQATWKELMSTPPVVIWTFVVVVMGCVGILKLFTYRPGLFR